VAFEQAGIEVQRVQEFSTLKSAVERALASPVAEKYLETLQSKGVRVRDWQAVLDKQLLEKAGALEKGSARALYDALGASDQGLIREFYLTTLEQVEPGLRQKFYRIYASY
jgi:hypothetical protein